MDREGLQVAREGLQEDRVGKPEGPVAMRGESHWVEGQEVRRMRRGVGRIQVGLEHWLEGLSRKVGVQEERHPPVGSREAQVA